MDCINKRVAALYRVSTKAQMEQGRNDIPMQENACKAFIKAKPGWVLEKEYYERGVSGYKKRADERDVLQQIKVDATKGLFDILLIFMLDRLGRREDETPFIMKWFSEQGIEIWSVKEGRQYADSRMDLLINFIKSWQSSGESEKTGIRVREKQTQMAKEGKFTGGTPPMGYDLAYSGEENKKGRRLKKLVVNEAECGIVQMMYRLNTLHGYGGRRIALYLNDKGIQTKTGREWSAATVNNLLKNPIYMGYPAYGKTTQVTGKSRRADRNQWLLPEIKNNDLAIIGEDEWHKSQLLRQARSQAATDKNGINMPRNTKSPLLLTGIVKCGHCGSALVQQTTYAKWETKRDGPKRKAKLAYKCWNNANGRNCSGQYSYSKYRLEEPVLKEMHLYLKGLKKRDVAENLYHITQKKNMAQERRLQQKYKLAAEKEKELQQLRGEIAKSLSGNSKFNPQVLQAAITDVQSEIETLLQEIKNKETADEGPGSWNAPEHAALLPDWIREFDSAPIAVKKMLVTEVVAQAYVFRDRLEIKFKLALTDFIGGNMAIVTSNSNVLNYSTRTYKRIKE